MTIASIQKNKILVYEFWQKLNEVEPTQFLSIMQQYIIDEIAWHGPCPLTEFDGIEALYAGFWQPLLQSFLGIQREDFIIFGGVSNGRKDGGDDGHEWVCGLGYFRGVFQQDWLGIPATNTEVLIRQSEFCRVENGKIVEIYILLDIPDLMRQAGYPVMPPDRGAIGLWPPPKSNDGLLLDAQDVAASVKSMSLIRGMIYDGLNQFDQSELTSMGMADFFSADLQWYGPSGIGGCHSLKEFEDFHQRHWLIAFPDREVQDLDSLFTEGEYMGASGWAGVIATHTGEYLDVPATGNTIQFNGIDIWKRNGNKLVENWVFVDMIDLYRQFGINLFERMQAQINANTGK
jgi:predicted ester cyclase